MTTKPTRYGGSSNPDEDYFRDGLTIENHQKLMDDILAEVKKDIDEYFKTLKQKQLRKK